MSVYPEFLQYIQEEGLYVEGYNYEEMYNIMVNNLTNNFIPSFCFIYSYDQMNILYDYLDNLLHSDITQVNESEDNEPNIIQTNQFIQMNQVNHNDNDSDDTESIYSDSDVDEMHIQITQPIQTTAQQLLNNYLANVVQHNINIVYYDNINNSNIYINSNNSNLN